MACKHADLMLIYAKQAAVMNEPWKLWECKMNVNHWEKLFIHPVWDEHTEYRQIPKTIRIGNYDVPEPMQEQPEFGQLYWFVDCSYESGVCAVVWSGDNYDYCRFTSGFCHLTRENCIIHAKALFSFSEVK